MSETSPIAVLFDSLGADRATLRAAVDAVPVHLRSMKPAPDRWSVSGVLEHLSIVERGALRRVRALIESAPRVDGTLAAPTAFNRELTRNRMRTISAPDAIRPTGTVSWEAAWNSLEESRVELLGVVEAARDRDLSRSFQDHPALGPLDGYQWITLIGAHEERHAMQIAEIHAAVATLQAAPSQSAGRPMD